MGLCGTTSSPGLLFGRLVPVASLKGGLTIPTSESVGGVDVEISEIPNESGGTTIVIKTEVLRNGN